MKHLKKLFHLPKFAAISFCAKIPFKLEKLNREVKRLKTKMMGGLGISIIATQSVTPSLVGPYWGPRPSSIAKFLGSSRRSVGVDFTYHRRIFQRVEGATSEKALLLDLPAEILWMMVSKVGWNK